MGRECTNGGTVRRHRPARLIVALAAFAATFGGLSATAAPTLAAKTKTATMKPIRTDSAKKTHNARSKHRRVHLTVKLVKHHKLGPILVTNAGHAIYILTSDPANTSTCTGACTSIWPPVTIKAGTKPRGGRRVKDLGTVTSGGKLQVTWHKHPLYTYAGDTAARMVNGNGINSFGGVWLAATPRVVAKSASTTTTKPTSGGGYHY